MGNVVEEFIDLRNQQFAQWKGTPKTPTDVVDHHVMVSRQLGKTTKLLNSLPNSQCIVVAHSVAWGKELKRALKRLRPDYDLKNVIIVTYSQLKAVDFDRMRVDKIRGLSTEIPMYVDSSVLDAVQYDFVKNLNWRNSYDV